MLALGTVASSLKYKINYPLFEAGLRKMIEALDPHTIIAYGSAEYSFFDELRKMSKSRSGIFPTTHGNDNILKVLTYYAVSQLIKTTPNGRNKSLACGAYDIKTGNIATAFAGNIPSEIHPELLRRAEKIGGIGTHGLSNKNTVGVCAEFHVVNQLLLSGSKITDIRLTNAIRPSTGKEQPFCINCKTMFNDLIH